MKYLILYQRNNGDILYRYRKSKPQKNIGSKTSMGWTILDVKLLNEGYAINESTYNTLLFKKQSILSYMNKISFDIKSLIEIMMLLYIIQTIFVK